MDRPVKATRARPDVVRVRYRTQDTPFGICRQTATRLSDVLRLSDTEVIHRALAELAVKHLPQYEPDDGPVSIAVLREIRRRVPGRMTVARRLF